MSLVGALEAMPVELLDEVWAPVGCGAFKPGQLHLPSVSLILNGPSEGLP